MNNSVLFHRENECEWRYVGIWADMLDKSILELEKTNTKAFLVLFKEYDTPLQIIQHLKFRKWKMILIDRFQIYLISLNYLHITQKKIY